MGATIDRNSKLYIKARKFELDGRRRGSLAHWLSGLSSIRSFYANKTDVFVRTRRGLVVVIPNGEGDFFVDAYETVGGEPVRYHGVFSKGELSPLTEALLQNSGLLTSRASVLGEWQR